MATPGDELGDLDFENLIGGPLIAVVHGQVQAAMATVNFIKQVGFKPPPTPPPTVETATEQTTGDLATVTFHYKKTVPKEDGTTEEKNGELTVPFLAMLPIPYLRIAETEIQFKAKINSVEFRQVVTNIAVTGDLEAKAGWLWGSARLKVRSAFQRQTREGSTVTKDYSMDVRVKAVQEEVPGGLDRLLSILESSIKEKVT